ncbi:Vesicle transport protein [Entamoeba marina]
MFNERQPLLSGMTSFFKKEEVDPQSSTWFDTLFEDEDKGTFTCISLTWSQRMLFATGFCFFGILSLSSQFRSLRTDPAKATAFVIYVSSIGATLFSGLYVESTFLTIFCVIIEVLACVWYIASYIPFAHSCLSATFKSCFR